MKKKVIKPQGKTQVLVRFNNEFLAELDTYLKNHGMVRNQYIAEAVIKKFRADTKSSK